LKGYLRIWKDRSYVSFVFAFTLTQICVSLVWILMAVYAKHNYGVMENEYGLIPTTNAIMVVLFQLGVTQITKRYPSMWVLTLGSILYAVGVGMVAFGHNFWGFWIAMVVVTLGELTLIPTATTFAANKAPAEMRGRYMSVYNLCWGVASGIGPLIGGFLNDDVGPKSTWYGGFMIGLVSAVFFAIMAVRPAAAVLPPKAAAGVRAEDNQE
jgi:MFS family permease